jgi:phosphate ABC transporter permease protein PstC
MSSTARPPSEGGSTGALNQVRKRLGDRAFRSLVLVSGYALLILLLGIAIFLIIKAVPALHHDKANFFTSFDWNPDDTPAKFGIGVLAYGTLVSAAIALIVAVPVALGVALFIAYYAPRRLAAPLGYLIDLLAAVPSVVYGLWGLLFLVDYSQKLQIWITKYFGWTHVLNTSSSYGKSFFVAGTVLAVMILPIVAAISREIFLQVPQTQREAALALGATKWEMIKWSAFPYARSGIASAVVLGFGRALGETIAVALVLSSNYQFVSKLFTPSGNTIAANIANQFPDAGKIGIGALIASGLVLFVITLVVNLIARFIARQAVPAGSVV